LHRKNTRGQFTEKEFTDLWSDMATIPIESVRHRELLDGAFEIAVEDKLSVYDATYLALALRTGSSLFTADDQLAEASSRRGL
jgi:predicted nucleic acid-binding protein